MRKHKAFTLVELLVVIGIIVVLISILLPAGRRALGAARKTQCLSQMRQIGTALMAYAAANGGRTPVQPSDQAGAPDPTHSGWADPRCYNQPEGRNAFAAFLPLLGNNKDVYLCPAALDAEWTGGGLAQTAVSDTNYMGNHAVTDRRLSQIKRAAGVIFLQEDRYRWRIAWLRPADYGRNRVYTSWTWDNGSWGQEYSSLHDAGGNLLFLDGHAEYRKYASLRPRDFGLTGGPNLSGTPDDLPRAESNFKSYRADWDAR